MTRMLLVIIAAALSPVTSSAEELRGIVQSDAIKWRPLSRAQTVGGPTIHVLWGDPQKSGGGFLLKLPAEGALPERVSATQYTVVVISGAWLHASGDGEFIQIAPGGYFTQLAKERHRDRCLAGTEDCVVFIRTVGRFDLKPVKQDSSGEVKAQVREGSRAPADRR